MPTIPRLRPGLAAAVLLAALAPAAGTAAEVRVLTFNVYWGATLTPDALERTVAVIRDSGADIVGLQEKMTYDERGEAFAVNGAQEIARRLGWQWVDQRKENPGAWNDTAILSRLPLRDLSANETCVLADGPAGPFRFCNIHLMSAPYQPYQLLGIPYRDAPFLKTEGEAVAAATAARGAGLDALLADLEAADAGTPTILTGDFNEPSHLDWTQDAAKAGLHPLKVAYPATERLAEAGFTDAYRTIHPDEVGHPGQTWTPTTAPGAADDHHDRIDFVFVRGPGVSVRAAEVLGEAGPMTDRAMEPWPSDHRAVLATVELPGPAPAAAPSP